MGAREPPTAPRREDPVGRFIDFVRRSRLLSGAAAYLIVLAALLLLPATTRPSDPLGLSLVAAIVALLVAGRRRPRQFPPPRARRAALRLNAKASARVHRVVLPNRVW